VQRLQLQIAGNKCKSQEFILQALKSHQSLQVLLKNNVQNATRPHKLPCRNPLLFTW